MTATPNPIRLEIFKHLFAAVPEEMGALLKRASFSPNIKERLDYSCALFDADANLVAQAAHLPVHLGAMPMSVQAAVKAHGDALQPGDAIILNDPYHGGSHLPDITIVSPVFSPSSISGLPSLFGFVASRAHHADVGGMKPGSMPIAREIIQEGIIIPPVKLVKAGEIDADLWAMILANVRTPEERAGDLRAQLAANARGARRMQEMLAKYGPDEISMYANALLTYTERLTRRLISDIPDGTYSFEDYLDNDGVGDQPILIQVAVTIHGETATVDFSGSAPQQRGSVNAVRAITVSATAYVFRCLLGADVPDNGGALAALEIITPAGTVVNANWPSPVAGGNVETSQRITDVLLGALAQAVPDRIPAASQGTMNNTLIGGMDTRSGTARPYTYYETIAGGHGGNPESAGLSARHSHMTNTLNTPVEALEYAYPFLVERYEIRAGTGGAGKHPGGNGVRRDLRVLGEAEASLITERRARPPYGLHDGEPGAVGENRLIRDGEEIALPSKGSIDLQPGDVLSIRTPGGGGWGIN